MANIRPAPRFMRFKLVDLAGGGLEFGPKAGFPRDTPKNSGSSTHISPLTQWNSRATVL